MSLNFILLVVIFSTSALTIFCFQKAFKQVSDFKSKYETIKHLEDSNKLSKNDDILKILSGFRESSFIVEETVLTPAEIKKIPLKKSLTGKSKVTKSEQKKPFQSSKKNQKKPA